MKYASKDGNIVIEFDPMFPDACDISAIFPDLHWHELLICLDMEKWVFWIEESDFSDVDLEYSQELMRDIVKDLFPGPWPIKRSN